MRRDIFLLYHICPDGIIDVMVDIGDDIRDSDHLSFQSLGHILFLIIENFSPAFGMLEYPVPDFVGQVQPFAFILEFFHDTEALFIMGESSGEELGKSFLPSMSERSVSEVVPQRDGFGEILVQQKSPGNGAGDLRDLECVSQPGPVMVAERSQENLSFVLQSSEGFAVDDPVSVPLEICSQ